MSWIEDPGASEFEGLNLDTLSTDEAYLRLVDPDNLNLWLYTIEDDCLGCPFKIFLTESTSTINSTIISTTRGASWRFRTTGDEELVPVNNDPNEVCTSWFWPGEFGVYDFTAANNSEGTTVCDITVARQPVNIYFAFLIVFFIYLSILVLCYGGKMIYNRLWRKNSALPSLHEMSSVNSNLSNGSNKGKEEQGIRPRQRLRSLDTLRGLSMAVMIFVNDGAGGYWFFEHATWDGLQVADLVFPWFVWIMGVCVPISLRSLLKKKTPKLKIASKIIKRTVILFLLGIFLNSAGSVNWGTLRIMGVLQRLAIGYWAVALMGMALQKVEPPKPKNVILANLQDLIVLWPQWVLVGCLVLIHSLMTFLLPVPNCPTGYLEAGGISLYPSGYDGTSNYDKCPGGAAGYIDSSVFGQSHIYQNPTSGVVYGSGPFDPEGILGSLTTILQAFLGVQAGTTLLLFTEWRPRIVRWCIWGIICGGLAALLCEGTQTGGWIPINKNLWSLSFVFVTTSFGLLLLCFLYWIIDVKQWWSGTPFYHAGMNGILLYVGHQILYNVLPFNWEIGAMTTHVMLLVESCWTVSLWLLVAVWLYRKKIFLKI